YEAYTACTEIDRFVDILSKWYVRRSRRRFWKTEADDEKRASYSTLFKCLETITFLLAPVIPHVSEAIYQRMIRPVKKGSPESVHHNCWPEFDTKNIDLDLMAEMDLAMNLSSMGRAARSQSSIKLRQPLKEAVVVLSEEQINRFDKVKDLVKEELNIKEITATKDPSRLQSITVNPLATKLGPKHGRLYPKIQDAIKALREDEAAKLGSGEQVSITVEGQQIEIQSSEVEIKTIPNEEYSVVEEANIMVGVNKVISSELETEGLARDIVRRIQVRRKDLDFNIDDHITTYYTGDPKLEKVFTEESEYIKAETLSDELVKGKPPGDVTAQEYNINGLKVRLGLVKK
ncbi:MAG: DUF5915 domain-containing protein, partial [Candidatus Thorarchaeota archaeon]